MTAPVRTIALWCPDWPIVAAEVDPEVPAVVLRANRIVARTPAAAAEGILIGQRRRSAQRTCPHLELIPQDPDVEAEAFEPVARAVGRFTPGVEILEPGRLHLGARGPSRHFGGEASLARRLHEAVLTAALEVGPSARVGIGIADGRFAADLAAHLAVGSPDAGGPGGDVADRGAEGIRIVEPGTSAEFLAPIEITRLAHLGEIDPDTADLFLRLGLTRLGDLAALDPADVLARFGLPGRHAHRLAAGRDDRRPDAVPPEEPAEAALELDGPVDRLEPLVFAAKTLADDLTTALGADGRLCTRLTVTAETDHDEVDARTWHRAGGLDAAAMVERVRWQLAGWLGDGGPTAGIVRLRLEAIEVRADGGEQAALWGGTSELDERAARAVARLTTLVGDQAVLVPLWQGGRLPTERLGWVPAATVDLLDRRETTRRLGPLAPTPLGPLAPAPRGPLAPAPGGASGVSGRSRRSTDPTTAPWPGSLPLPSPTIVLPEPEPATLTDDAGRPVRVTGRGELDRDPVVFAVADQVPRIVTDWAGPWLVDERWWEVTRRRRLARLQILCDDSAHLVAIEGRRWWLLASYR